MNELLRRRFSDHSGIGLIPEDLDRMPEGALREKSLVSAHLSARHFPVLAPHRFVFTFLREPIDRVISNYHYLRSYDGAIVSTNCEVIARARAKNFHDFLLDDHPQVRSFTHNLQANTLAWDWRGTDHRKFSDLAKAAIDNLKQLDYIGFFESYPEDLWELFKKLHWQINPEEAHLVANKTPKRPAVSEVEPRTLALIRALNQADLQLYHFALEAYGTATAKAA